MQWKRLRDWFPVGWRETLITAGILLVASACCSLLHGLDASGSYASMVFVLAVMCVARVTTGYLYGIIASFVGVVATNYIFTYPYGALNFTITAKHDADDKYQTLYSQFTNDPDNIMRLIINGDTTTLEQLLEDYDEESVIEEGRQLLHIAAQLVQGDKSADGCRIVEPLAQLPRIACGTESPLQIARRKVYAHGDGIVIPMGKTGRNVLAKAANANADGCPASE